MMEDSVSVVTVRVATHDDVDKILYVSEGIYDGRDFLPIVLHEWLNDERKLIFLAEYDGEVIGLQVATIAENQQSFVTRALRIHHKYRGKRLSYQLIDAVIASVRTKYPQISKKFNVCDKYRASFVIGMNRGGKPIMEQKFQTIQKISRDELRKKCAESCDDTGLVPWPTKDALELYKSERVLHLIGSHSFIVDEKWFPYKLPEDAQFVINERVQVFVDVTLQEFQQGKLPKSFSQGVLSKGVETEVWLCQIYTDDAELCKKHFIQQMSAAAQSIKSQEFIFEFFQSSCSNFDGSKLVEDALSLLELDCEVKSEVQVLMEYALD